MLIRIADFKGQIPKLHPRLPPENFAQVAMNTRLEDGTIGPMASPVNVAVLATIPQAFIKHQGAFLGFSSANVKAAVGPVAQERLYYTGDGAPKMRVSGTVYPLAINPPASAPTVALQTAQVGAAPAASVITVTQPGELPATHHAYVYAAVYEGATLFCSAVSPIIARRVNQSVRLSGLSVPVGSTRIIVYRRDLPDGTTPLGTFNANQYGLIIDRPISDLKNGVILDDFSRTPDRSFLPLVRPRAGTFDINNLSNVSAQTLLREQLRRGAISWANRLDRPANDFAESGPSVGNAPAVSITAVEGKNPRYSYRFSAVVGGIETLASDATDLLEVGPGEAIRLQGFTFPAQATAIRIYRADAPDQNTPAGRYGLLREIAPSAIVGNQITDDLKRKADTARQPVSEADRAARIETVTYVCTYVTSFGEESAPSPASSIISLGLADTATVTVPAATQSGRGITKVRLYRSRTSLSGITDFYFLTELTLPTVAFVDSQRVTLNETMPSRDYDAPPDSMQGLIALPNGLMAAHTAREILFCEPFLPHAWPTKYRLSTDSDIVGLGAFGSYVVVLTKASPYIIQGSEPALMVMEKLEDVLPCLSARSIVDLGYSVAFASYDGLVLISQSGATVVTRGLFTPEQWRKMRPETISAAQMNGRYVFRYQPTVGGAVRFGIIDVSGQQPFFAESDITPTAMHFAAEDGALYFVQNSTQIREFDPRQGTTFARQRWRSKRFVLPSVHNFSCFLIEADAVRGAKAGGSSDPDCTIRFFANGQEIFSTTKLNAVGRLPAGFLSDQWEIEVEGYAPITSITLASDVSQIAGG